MINKDLNEAFSKLSTPLVFDACLRLAVKPRIAPQGIRPVSTECKLSGRVLPSKHFGSVDVFLEAMGSSDPGDVLIVDNNMRRDEGCVGDLTALEARASGLAGLVVWGCHRDTVELLLIGFPVFSYGACLAGPQRLDPQDADALETAVFGDFSVGRQDVVFADDDGVLFAPLQEAEKILSVASEIDKTERRQTEHIRQGNTLRKQLKFDDYLSKRTADSSYTFRQHLRKTGGAIEE